MSNKKPSQEKIDYILNLFKSNQIQQSLDCIKKLAKDYPDNSLLLNIRGACYAGLGQLDLAVQNYEKALPKSLIQELWAKWSFERISTISDIGQLHNDSTISNNDVNQNNNSKSDESSINSIFEDEQKLEEMTYKLKKIFQKVGQFENFEKMIVSMKKSWVKNSNSQYAKLFQKIENHLKRDEINMLVFQDFNTDGLQGNDSEKNTFKHCVNDENVSVKSRPSIQMACISLIHMIIIVQTIIIVTLFSAIMTSNLPSEM